MDETLLKICSKCTEIKKPLDFYKSKITKDGLLTQCKACYTSYYYANKKKINEYSRNWPKKNREKSRKNKRLWKELNSDKIRNNDLLRKFGITLDYYNKLLIDQNYLCAICSGPQQGVDRRTKKIRSLVVDHDHKTGKVRGLLCDSCNLNLVGKHTVETAKKLLKYLEKNEAQNV